MNENEEKGFESRLRGFPPARLPEQLAARILAGRPWVQARLKPQLRQRIGLPGWFRAWRWLAPATAAAVIVLAVWRDKTATERAPQPGRPSAVAPLRAEGVELEQKLVSSFDTVAQLSSGEPVRFRVQKWEDQVVLNDKARGLLVKESRPRWVVVPVRYETY
jgi:hypothetical protein